MAKAPKFLPEFGLGLDSSSLQAYSLLDDIIGRRGGSNNQRLADIRKGIDRRGGAGASQALLNIRSQEAQTQDQRRLGDLQLVDSLLNKPGLESRNLQLQRLRNKVIKKGGEAQIRGQLFRGLGSLVSSAADIYSTYKNREPGQNTPSGYGVAAQSDRETGQQLDIFGNPVE